MSDFAKTASLASSIASRSEIGRVTDGAERLDRGRARDFAAAVAAHAVGDRDEIHRLVDEVAVFVAFAHTTDVGRGADDESHVTAMSACDLGDGVDRTAPCRHGARVARYATG